MFEWTCLQCEARAQLPDAVAIARLAEEHGKTHVPEAEKAPERVIAHASATTQRDPGPFEDEPWDLDKETRRIVDQAVKDRVSRVVFPDTVTHPHGLEYDPTTVPQSDPRLGDWRSVLGHRVRIYDGQRMAVRAEGRVVGIITVPTLVVREDDGRTFYEASSLPIEVMKWEPLR